MIGILKTEVNNTDRDFFAVKNLNQLVNTTTNACLFCNHINNEFQLPVLTNVLQRSHCYSFNGILITDDLIRAQDLIHTTYAKKRFLYLYHLDWPFITQLQFHHINSIFFNDNIELIARSVSHAKLIEDLFKKPKYIMKEWDYQTLMELDQNE